MVQICCLPSGKLGLPLMLLAVAKANAENAVLLRMAEKSFLVKRLLIGI